MRPAITGLLIFTAVFCGLSAQDSSVASVVARIAAVERQLPWLWSPAAEGLSDIPYTYEARMARRLRTRSGKEIPPVPGADALSSWRALHLERIPLDFGAHFRCLSQDGASPCSSEWVQEFQRQAKSRDALTPEDRARIERTRQERRLRRRDFWDRFPAAFRFESVGANQLRFSPLPGYKAPPGSTGIQAAIAGRLSFDPSTYEITRLEYDLLRDADEPFLRLPKGAHFKVALSRSTDQHYLPLSIFVRRERGKARDIEERTDEFSNFRRFESESKLQFADPPAYSQLR